MVSINIFKEAPKAWSDFMKFYKEKFFEEETIKNTNFLNLPFEMQLGLYLSYFNENSLDWDIQNVAASEWPAIILEVFKTQEKIIGHFS